MVQGCINILFIGTASTLEAISTSFKGSKKSIQFALDNILYCFTPFAVGDISSLKYTSDYSAYDCICMCYDFDSNSRTLILDHGGLFTNFWNSAKRSQQDFRLLLVTRTKEIDNNTVQGIVFAQASVEEFKKRERFYIWTSHEASNFKDTACNLFNNVTPCQHVSSTNSIPIFSLLLLVIVFVGIIIWIIPPKPKIEHKVEQKIVAETKIEEQTNVTSSVALQILAPKKNDTSFCKEFPEEVTIRKYCTVILNENFDFIFREFAQTNPMYKEFLKNNYVETAQPLHDYCKHGSSSISDKRLPHLQNFKFFVDAFCSTLQDATQV